MKTLLFWFWTAICLLGMSAFVWGINRGNNYTGTEISFTISQGQQIDLDGKATVTIEAASNRFFAFRNEAGIVVGVLTPKPLGWSGEYFTAGPVEIQTGTWVVENGDGVTVRLNSSENMAVREALRGGEKVVFTLITVLLGLLIWFAVLFVGPIP